MFDPSTALSLRSNTPEENGSGVLASAQLISLSTLLHELAYRSDNFFLGQDVGGGLIGTPAKDDTHVLVCGGTRADKGTSISNTLLNRRSSIYFTSTKPQYGTISLKQAEQSSDG